MHTQPLEISTAEGHKLAAKMEYPADRKPLACAIFAHCFTCGKDFTPTRNISRALTTQGIAVLRFDFTGLGYSDGEFADTNFSSNIQDLLAAAKAMEEMLDAPQLLIGHSLGGTAVLMAAQKLPQVRAVATIGSPAFPEHVTHLLKSDLPEIEAKGEAVVDLGGRPFRIKKQFLDDLQHQNMDPAIENLGKALLVLHSPQDRSVSIENAREIYEKARHPKSFISLDGADHLLLNPADSRYAGEVIGHWAKRYIELRPQPRLTTDLQVVANTQADALTTEILAGKHGLTADEPTRIPGGMDLGPTPYDLLMSALGACTNMTLQLYAKRKGWDLQEVEAHLKHTKIHGEDITDAAGNPKQIDHLTRELVFTGDLTDEQRARLVEIANKCPVHRTLENGVHVTTEERPGEAPTVPKA